MKIQNMYIFVKHLKICIYIKIYKIKPILFDYNMCLILIVIKKSTYLIE